MMLTPRFRRSAILAAAVLLGGAAALYVREGGGNGAAACRAAAPALERMRPLARGEVAAVSVPRSARPAPEIGFLSPGGTPMRLADLRGRVTLVNLWATWCGPCRQEMPALDRLQAELGGADFEVVAVNVDTRNLERPRLWLQENGITRLAHYADPKGELLQTLQRTGHAVGLPTTLIVDAQGCEIGVLKGPAEWASADALALIRAALGRS